MRVHARLFGVGVGSEVKGRGELMASSNKETRRKVQEAWNQKRFDDLDQYFAPDFKAKGNDPSGPPTLAAAKASNGVMNQIFSERRVEILDLLEDGDKVFMRNRATGKHTGE